MILVKPQSKVMALCVGLALVTLFFPHWIVAGVVFAGTYWISAYAIRTEMRQRAVPIAGSVIDDEA